MANLPKNVYQIAYKNKDGKKQYKYQVQKLIQGKKYNKLFDTIEECETYLNEIKSHFGRKGVVEYDVMQQHILEQWKNPNFEFFFMEYFKWKNPSNYDKSDLLKHKAFHTYKSFYNTILNTKIVVYDEEKLKLSPQISSRLMNLGINGALTKKTTLAKLKLHEITYKTINSYIKARLELGKSKITIRKEVSILSTFFQEIRYVDSVPLDTVDKLDNPTKLIDKRLLANAYNGKKAKRISNDNWDKLMECINKEEDLTFSYIFFLQYFGALRMSEALYLDWSFLDFENKTITLPRTKTTPRVVMMTKNLEDLLDTIEPNKDKRIGIVVKDTTLYKYQKQIQRYRDRYGISKDFSSHQARKDAISRMIDNVGGSNSIQLAQILGYKNVAQFKEDYLNTTPNLNSVEGVMNNVGHSQTSINTTSKSYYELPKIEGK